LKATNIVIDDGANISAPSGYLSFNAYSVSPSRATYLSDFTKTAVIPDDQLPAYSKKDDRGNIVVGQGVTFSTAGEVVNYGPSAATTNIPPDTMGGTIMLQGNNVSLSAGSVVDVSGGAKISTSGKVAYDAAGTITINSGNAVGSGFGAVVGGRLTLAGELKGYAGLGAPSGTLAIQTSAISIDEKYSSIVSRVSTDPINGTLLLAPDFFSTGGFSTFTLAGLGAAIDSAGDWTGATPAFVLADHTTIAPQVQNWRIPLKDTDSKYYTADPRLIPPVSLTFQATDKGAFANANGLPFLDQNNVPLNKVAVVLGENSSISAGTLGQVSLSAGLTGTIDLRDNSSIVAHGGSINISQKNNGFFLPTIHLGKGSILDVSGAAIYSTDSTGIIHATDVADGGRIILDGNIVADPSSKLDAFGTSAKINLAAGNSLDLALRSPNGSLLVSTIKDSSGGTITLTAEQMLFTAADLKASAGMENDGSTTAHGGTLIVNSKFSPNLPSDRRLYDPSLIISDTTPLFTYKDFPTAVMDGEGNVFGDPSGFGRTIFGADCLKDAGFSSLSFLVGTGVVQVQGAVGLKASRQITIADGGVLAFGAGAQLNLAAPYVVLGTPFTAPSDNNQLVLAPTTGDGRLTVNASSLIDVGNLVLQGASKVNLTAHYDPIAKTNGAIRGDGTLAVAGEIDLTADQIYPPTAAKFTIIATSAGAENAGIVKILPDSSLPTGSSLPPTPLSVGGTLEIYASEIDQGGVLRAPLGKIQLGSDSSSIPDPITGITLPVTKTLNLKNESVTSVSAAGVTIPYGITVDGATWIDPTGTDITSTGPIHAAKTVKLTAGNVTLASGSTVDLSGGAGSDLLAYEFVSGTGGTVDILSSSAASFAILPGYVDSYAPYAAFTTTTVAAQASFGSDPGYIVGNAKLNYHVGDRIYLENYGSLQAGYYTLLPVRYAVLDGAYLVTPPSSTNLKVGATPTVINADGSALVSGYRYNGFDQAGKNQTLFQSFTVKSKDVIRNQADYVTILANTFFEKAALTNSTVAPRLPVDAGQLTINAGAQLELAATIEAASTEGRGGLVDITTTNAQGISIVPRGGATSTSDGLTLIDSALNGYNAESLLIGGIRKTGAGATADSIDVSTPTIKVGENAQLTGSDIILAATGGIEVDDGAKIQASSNSPNFAAEDFAITAANTNPNGVLVRVAADSSATFSRSGNTTSASAAVGLTVNKNVTFGGASVLLDSSGNIALDDSAILGGTSTHLSLDSGQISLVLQPAALGANVPSGLVIQGSALSSLSKVAALSLLSYNTIDIYGSGALSTKTFDSLALHASALRGDGNGGAVTIAANELLLDNSPGGATPSPTTGAGKLEFDANTIHLGVNQFALQNFTAVTLKASSNILLEGTAKNPGTTKVKGGTLTIQAPAAVAAPAASQIISADGELTLKPWSTASSSDLSVPSGLGANLSLVGSRVDISTAVNLPSGTLSVVATNGGVSIDGGKNGGQISVAGTKQDFYNVSKYTNGGNITLQANAGDVTVATGSVIDVGADAHGGSAGALTISAMTGNLSIADATLSGQKGVDGLGGSFSLDAKNVSFDTGSNENTLSALNRTLKDGGFTDAVSIRVRSGDVVIDGTAKAHSYAVSADHGNITVTGTIDASSDLIGTNLSDLYKILPTTLADNLTGGSVSLSATGSVTLKAGSQITAAGYCYDNAGNGGSISLSAGGYTYTTDPMTQVATGSVDGSAKVVVERGPTTPTIDLSVANQFTTEDLVRSNTGTMQQFAANLAQFTTNHGRDQDLATGTLHLRESRAALLASPTQFDDFADGRIKNASSIVLEGFMVYNLVGNDGTITPNTDKTITTIATNGLIDLSVENQVKADGATFASGVASSSLFGSSDAPFHFEPGAEIVNSTTPDQTQVTNNLVTLTSSSSNSTTSVKLTLAKATSANPSTTSTITLPGGIPAGDTLKIAGLNPTMTSCDVTYYDVKSGTSRTAHKTTTISPTDSEEVTSITFFNTSKTTTPTVSISFTAGTTPVTLAIGAISVDPKTTPTTTYAKTSNATTVATYGGDLTLGGTWDLSSFRFATPTSKSEPGILTLRSQGNLVLNYDASLTDGFAPDSTNSLWLGTLTADRSWSYRLVAGADLAAADNRKVQSLATLTSLGSGSVQLGKGSPNFPTTTSSLTVAKWYQTIRTGTGEIDIYAGNDVQFLSPLVSVYTAGAQDKTQLPGFDTPDLTQSEAAIHPVQYSFKGGNVAIFAQHDIIREILNPTTGGFTDSSSKEMPTSWLDRRGNVGADGYFSALSGSPSGEIQSTTWWVDFSNFFNDVGALGGGNVTLAAGNDVKNVNASVPTNARMPYKDGNGNMIAPNASNLVEFGGGDLAIRAGRNIDGGVYYAERGDIALQAGGAVQTNSTRYALGATIPATPDNLTLLPTTLFLGKGRVNVSAAGNIELGAVANPFWLYQSVYNSTYEKTYFTTFDQTDTVDVTSAGGDVTLQVNPDSGTGASLAAWYTNIFTSKTGAPAASQAWLGLGYSNVTRRILPSIASVLPGTLRVAAFSGAIDLVGTMNLAPAKTGTLDLLAANGVNGVSKNGVIANNYSWGSASINLSDASPASLPSITTPLAPASYVTNSTIDENILSAPASLIAETGTTSLSLAQKLLLHGLVRDATDVTPVHIYTLGGDISGLTLFSGKSANIVAAQDITDVAFYIQNLPSSDISVVAAGRDIIAYDPASALRLQASASGGSINPTPGSTAVASGDANAGDIQIAGPGTLEVMAGRNFDLGNGNRKTSNGTAAGLTSVGSIRNPNLPQNSGADIVAMAGLGNIDTIYTPAASTAAQTPGLITTSLGFSGFISSFLTPNTENGDRYLPVVGAALGLAADTSNADIARAIESLDETKVLALLDVFYRVLRDAGRDHNDSTSPYYRTYTQGVAAINALFPDKVQGASSPWLGNITMSQKLIKTTESGNITLLAPGGQVVVGLATDLQSPDQGILTQRGGAVSIFASGNVGVGTSRIFTLRGGDEIVWSSLGNIAAGSGSKTVHTAPPTRVLVDPQSADVQNDLAGLATGSGIGVLATLAGVTPGDVDLIAPKGTIDAGDAGIRSSGKVSVSALVVVNASNIQSSAGTSGTPVVVVPNISGLTTASTASAGATNSAGEAARQQQRAASQQQEDVLPSIIQVEVLGYGGGEGDDVSKKKDDAGNG
jgi:hypothetical protein